MTLIIIAHNIRSAHNVGSILRSCDGFGVAKFYATGYTPYPAIAGDNRLPHERNKRPSKLAKQRWAPKHLSPWITGLIR